MRVLKSLAGAGRSVKLTQMFVEEDGDMFVIFNEPIGLTCFPDYMQNDVWYFDNNSIHDLIKWLTPIIIPRANFKLYVYGNFSDDDLIILKAWSDKYKNMTLTVTKQLPRDVIVGHGQYGPFVVDVV